MSTEVVDEDNPFTMHRCGCRWVADLPWSMCAVHAEAERRAVARILALREAGVALSPLLRDVLAGVA